jgi:putative dimethyl sulfoxide reductase chaperone
MQTTPTTSLLNDAQAAQARSLAYDLFARLFLDGPSPATWERLAVIPDLKKTLGNAQALRDHEADQAASHHFHLFGFNIFPYQSLFLDVEGSLGGQESERVLRYYRQAGFNLWPGTPMGIYPSGESPDHIGLELAFLGFLSGAEADALQDGEALHALRIQTLQRDFLDLHLLPWLPVLVQAISMQEAPFYTELARLTLELVSEQRAALGNELAVRRAAFALPHPPALMENEKTGLKDIASYLLTPGYSGFYFSREDIARLGRVHRLPRGFGGRTQTLTNLLRTAADYDQLPMLVSDLLTLLDEWQAAYQTYAEEVHLWESFAEAWIDRLQATRAMLSAIRFGASLGEEPE